MALYPPLLAVNGGFRLPSSVPGTERLNVAGAITPKSYDCCALRDGLLCLSSPPPLRGSLHRKEAGHDDRHNNPQHNHSR
jgi:hypothetical protein